MSRLGMLAIVGLLACSPDRDETGERFDPAARPLDVYVVNYPLQYFTERIVGEHARVTFPAPPDVDPAHWSPGPEIITAYQNAGLILLNGAGYAGWIRTATLPARKRVDTSQSFSDRLIPIEAELIHQHGPRGEHTHAATQSTVWLDMRQALKQGHAIENALLAARPALEGKLAAGLSRLEKDLLALDAEILAAARKLGDTPVVFSHPVYGYLERRYGLNGRSLHWEPDERPSEEMWGELRALLAEHPAPLMIWEDEPLSHTAQRLAGLGVRVVVFRPCGGRCGDWLEEMRANAARLGAAADLLAIHPNPSSWPVETSPGHRGQRTSVSSPPLACAPGPNSRTDVQSCNPSA